MLTKKKFAEMLVVEFCQDNDIELNTEDLSYLSRHICKSSSLCVALEYLGVLSGRDLQYAKTRAGTLKTGNNFEQEFIVLSAREIMELLPE